MDKMSKVINSEKSEVESLKEEVEKLNKVIFVRNKDVELWMNDYYDSQDDLLEANAKLDELTKLSCRLIDEIQDIRSLGGLLRKSDLVDTHKLAAELENLVVKIKEEQQETCQDVIPNTFIACGEGDNFCSNPCMTKDEQAKNLAKELTDICFSTLLENGSGSTIADAWAYWEEEWKCEEKSNLSEEIFNFLKKRLR